MMSVELSELGITIYEVRGEKETRTINQEPRLWSADYGLWTL